MIFDPKAQALANRRAVNRQARIGTSFLLKRAAEDAASRIADISRQFKSALIIGPFDVRGFILAGLPTDKHPIAFDYMQCPSELAKKYELVISVLHLQSDENLPQTLMNIRHHLVDDGLFLGAIFGGTTLTELRQTLYAADQAMLGGVAARIIPMVDYSQCAALLGHAGLTLPVVDMDRFTVSYKALSTLISDLRDLGLSNCLSTRSKQRLPKAYLAKAEALYKTHFSRDDGKLKCQFEILWMSGWAPHGSQQKPLKPGSAKMRLGEALGVIEQSLKR